VAAGSAGPPARSSRRLHLGSSGWPRP